MICLCNVLTMFHTLAVKSYGGAKGTSPRKSIGEHGQEKFHEVLLQQYYQQ